MVFLMSKKKILTVVGARPQFIKSAALSYELNKITEIEEVIVHSGQHYDRNMSSNFIDDLFIKNPTYIMKAGKKNELDMISYIIIKMKIILETVKPKLLIVFGDTTTTLAATVAAKKSGIPIAHIEAGVRNYDENMPEEVNRYLVDKMAKINFCTTSLGKKNLNIEGIKHNKKKQHIYISGDLMFDLFKKRMKKLKNEKYFYIKDDISKKNFILCTIHRASNVDNKNNLKNIISALNQINKSHPIIFPIHPRTKNMIETEKIKCSFSIIDPVTYDEMLRYLYYCNYVITDSGGLVREAFFQKKKSLLILEKPLWPEINELDCSKNSAPKKNQILQQFKILKKVNSNFSRRIFGKGDSAKFISRKIREYVSTNY